MTAEVWEQVAAFIVARLAEDEMWARGASRPYEYAEPGSTAPAGGVSWRWVTGGDLDTIDIDPVGREFVAPAGGDCNLATVEEWPTVGSYPRMMPRTCAYSIVEMDSAAAGHILRHDPRKVLRRVESARRTVARCTAILAVSSHHTTVESCDELDAILAQDVLEDLAACWDWHPDYEAWLQ